MTPQESLNQRPGQPPRAMPTVVVVMLVLLVMIAGCVSRPQVVYQEMSAVSTEMRRQTVWHKVTAGPYRDENAALAVRRQLEDQLGVRPFLRRLPL